MRQRPVRLLAAPLRSTLGIGLCGLFLAAPAFAADAKPAGDAQLAGPVEVPLYGGVDGADPYHYVEFVVGEQKLLMRLATGYDDVRLTEAAAKRLGLKAKGDDKKAKVESATIGGLALSGVTVKVTGLADTDFDADGELGLAAFPQLAWAIVPSQGVVRFAPAESGAQLVAQVGGQTLDYRGSGVRKEKLGKEKETLEATPYVVAGTWSGVTIDTELVTQTRTDMIPRELEEPTPYTVKDVAPAKIDLPDAPSFEVGVERYETREASVGGITATTIVARRGLGPKWVYLTHAQVGQDVLGAVDLAVDPVNHKLAMKAADTVTRASFTPTVEARLRKALEAKAAEGETPTDKQVQDARKGGIPALSAFLWSTGRTDEAIELSRELTRLQPEACTSWLGLGSQLLDAGKAQDAVEPLTRAADLYLPWSQISLAERKDLAKDYAGAQEKETAWDGPVPQDHACHVAVGKLALAKVALKDAAAVAQLYPARLDLDPGLAIAGGLAALQAGKADVAEAAFRQAVKLTVGEEPEEARAGLFLALAARDPALAQAQLVRTRGRVGTGYDPYVLQVWAADVRARQGAAAAVAALKALVDTDPDAGPVQLAYGQALAAAGDTAGAAKAYAAAAQDTERALKLTPRHEGVLAVRAMTLAAQGNAAEAQKLAEQATKASPNFGLSWIAMADAAQAAGDATKAAEYRKRAGALELDNPIYAQLALQ